MLELEPPAHPPIVVWVVDDNEDYLGVIETALNLTQRVMCTATFPRCEPAFDSLRTVKPPQVLLLDIGLPGINGIDAIQRFKEIDPALQIVMLTVFDIDEKVLAALRAGASGYLLKASPVNDIVRTVEQASSGEMPLDPRVTRNLVQNLYPERRRPTLDYQLRDRELQILRYLKEGHSFQEIARQMFISIHTVNSHVQHINEKMNVNSRAQAVAKAVREGLI